MIGLKEKFNIRGDNGEIEIDFTKESIEDLSNFDGSLVITFYNGNYVMTYHPKRNGWEFPAGSRKGEETSEECAKRETFEETGAILKTLEPIGIYTIKSKEKIFKTIIFIGDVERFEPKPHWSETNLVKLFDSLPNKVSYSDDVYKIVLHKINEINIT